MSDEGITKESIEQEFPGWEAWQGIDRPWHARIRGATPPEMVHGEDLVDLRDQVKRRISDEGVRK
jgi:broad specificity phosphatase PhoE